MSSNPIFRIIQLSDTHLSEQEPGALQGWRAAVRYIKEVQPDLIIHTGDIVRDDPSNIDDHRFASREMASLGLEVLSIPGNHDIGDGPPLETAIDHLLVSKFSEYYGHASWIRQIGSWCLIGVNAMLFGSGGPEEAEQWAWFADGLESASRGGTQLAVFVHKPPFLVQSDEPNTASSATMPFVSRERFWRLVKSNNVKLVACGHRHEYRHLHHDSTQLVWAPTTSDLLKERSAPLAPQCFPGLVEYAFIGPTLVHRVVPLAQRL